jgi:hypothetical protein
VRKVTDSQEDKSRITQTMMDWVPLQGVLLSHDHVGATLQVCVGRGVLSKA